MTRIVAISVLILTTFALQGCLAIAAGGAVVGVTGAVIGGTAKGVGAVGRAIIPGDSRDRDENK